MGGIDLGVARRAVAIALVAAGATLWPAIAGAKDCGLSTSARRALEQELESSKCPVRADAEGLTIGCAKKRLEPAADLAGFIDEATARDGKLSVRGWAADLNGSCPASVVLLIVDDKLRSTAQPSLPREDVARAHGNSALTNSGYVFETAVAKDFDPAKSKIRVFAVNGDSKARELIEGWKTKR